MPIMLPPGQATTVAIPNPAPPAATPPKPPEPFRKVQGPDVAILPHAETPQASNPQPSQ